MSNSTRSAIQYHETQFDDYLDACENWDMHPELAPMREKAKEKLSTNQSIIVYGPAGVGKYTQMLRLISSFSPSRLKYEKRITVDTEKLSYQLRISDIHYEIDMGLLGCSSKSLFHELFFHIVDIVSMKGTKQGTIVCINMHLIQNELLDVIDSYFQQAKVLESSSIYVNFILISQQIGFLPRQVYENFFIFAVKRPTKETYLTLSQLHKIEPSMQPSLWSQIEPGDIQNSKEVFTFDTVDKLPEDLFNICCDAVLEQLIRRRAFSTNFPKKSDFVDVRETLYDCLVYNLDIGEVIWYLIYNLCRLHYLPKANHHDVMENMIESIKYFNNNYRPIYHLEHIFFKLWIQIHGL